MESKELIAKLSAPFHPLHIEWRIAQAGGTDDRPWAKCFAYVDNRAIVSRLDEVFGPLGWKSELHQLNPVTYTEYDKKAKETVTKTADGFLASISAWDPEHKIWVSKMDGANNTDFEPIKGGISGALKRAGSSWGIGRYLYDLPEGWAYIHPNGVEKSPINGKWLNWSPPSLPAFALPSEEYSFENMQTFLKENYKEEFGTAEAKVGTTTMPLARLLTVVKEHWGKDYYLTLYAYEALRNLLT